MLIHSDVRVTTLSVDVFKNDSIVCCLLQIQTQLNKALDDMSVSLCTLKEGMSYAQQLPSEGLTQSQVLDKIRQYETLSKC